MDNKTNETSGVPYVVSFIKFQQILIWLTRKSSVPGDAV